MFAKLESLRFVLVDLAITVEHVACHKGAVVLRKHALWPWRAEQVDGVGLGGFGIDVAAICERNAPEDQFGEQLLAVVLPGVVLPDAVHDAHHADFRVHPRADILPFGCVAELLGDAHECPYDGVHAAPAQKPERAGVVVEDRALDRVRSRRLPAHVALERDVAHVGAAHQLLGRGEVGLACGPGVRL